METLTIQSGLMIISFGFLPGMCEAVAHVKEQQL